MNVNSDLTKRAVVHGASQPWIASPMPGVERRMFDRIGGEVARATSIVRYAPGSRFSPHTHDGGEEYLVLSGVFEDEGGAYPTGTYVRNPRGTSHAPSSTIGCMLFVKLWQFDSADTKHLQSAIKDIKPTPCSCGPGMVRYSVFESPYERVYVEDWGSKAEVNRQPDGGIEILVLSGTFVAYGEIFSELSWLRLPPGEKLVASAGHAGCRVWIKDGHLANPERLKGPALSASA